MPKFHTLDSEHYENLILGAGQVWGRLLAENLSRREKNRNHRKSNSDADNTRTCKNRLEFASCTMVWFSS